jgi:hypothetical protein
MKKRAAARPPFFVEKENSAIYFGQAANFPFASRHSFGLAEAQDTNFPLASRQLAVAAPFAVAGAADFGAVAAAGLVGTAAALDLPATA